MNIEKAIEILELHNKWRRDNEGKFKMAEPKELGIAIDTAVREFKNLHLQNVSGSALDFYTDLMKLINAYCKKGLKKPDLVHKMEYATESCKLS